MSAVTIVGKGEGVQLKGKRALQQALLGAGWDVNEGQSSHDFDLDLSLVTRNAAGKTLKVCYYGEKVLGNWVKHDGDNLTGAGEGDDEVIRVDLSKIPEDVAYIDAILNLYEGKSRGQHFGMVDEAFIRLVNSSSNKEVVRMDISNSKDAWEKLGLWLARIDVRNAPEFINVSRFDDAFATLDGFNKAVLPSHLP